MMETSTRLPARESAASRDSSAARSKVPRTLAGISSRLSGEKRPPHRTDGCSTAETSRRSRGRRSLPSSMCGVKASMLASGAPEANMLALTPHIELGSDRRPRDLLLVSAVEHPSVRWGGRFSPDSLEEIPARVRGTFDLAALESRLAALSRAGSRVLVSIMLANNESGVVQPIQNAAEMIHAAGGLLHVDAVQAAGRIPCAMDALGADLLSLSSHKLGGPKGAGALIIGPEALHLADPLIRGVGQERGSRAGTQAAAAPA